MKVRLKFEVYKTAADLGYKFDNEALEDLIKAKSNNTSSPIKKYSTLIPFYNLYLVVIKEDNYYKKREEYFNILKSTGVLEEMTEEEKKEYIGYRTGFHALKISKRRQQIRNNASKVILKDGSKIWFRFKEDTNTVEIIEVKGTVAGLSELAQKQIVYSLLKEPKVSLSKVPHTYNNISKQLIEEQRELNHNQYLTKDDNIKKKVKVRKR